jgi:Peptidase family M28
MRLKLLPNVVSVRPKGSENISMLVRRRLLTLILLSLTFVSALSTCALAADKKSAATTDTAKPSYELPQPATESLDLDMYQRIREEGLHHSHVMEYASALFDGIGPRLTGSPNMKRANEWTRDQLTAMGCSNAHLEDWGEFGMGWQQRNTWVHMTSPDTAVFIAQAAPWSPATNGAITAPVVAVKTIKEEKDFDAYKGKLAGKIILYGQVQDANKIDAPLFSRFDEKALADIAEYPLDNDLQKQHIYSDEVYEGIFKKVAFREKVEQFFANEKALAIIVPSGNNEKGGGTGGTIYDDTNYSFGWFVYQRDKAMKVPEAVMSLENHGRVSRLLEADVPVSIEMNIDTRFTGDHEHGFNTIAEIPGTDPKFKDQVAMVGGHLDSWIAGTGATDDGAGAIVAIEAMRILNAVGVRPRRTIRIGLWSGEEQGIFGSSGYVKQHLGTFPLSTGHDQLRMPEFVRKPAGPLTVKPEQRLISAYFNIDNGGGKIRGVYLQGNEAIQPIFQQWIAPIKDLGVTTLTMRDTGGTDHLPFDAVGVPGFQFIQDELDYETRSAHTNMDTYERLQAGDLRQIAVVEAIFLYNTAMRDQMLPRKPLPHPELHDQQSKPLKNVMPGAEASAADEKQSTPK